MFLLAATTGNVVARSEVSKKTSCYEIKNEVPSKKYSCVATDAGGAGTMVTIYNFNNKKYEIVITDDLPTPEMNKLPVIGYARDKSLKRTEDENKVAYYCYVTKKEHICASQ